MIGVYRKKSGKYCSVSWDSLGKLTYHGTYITEEEASSARVANNHHWKGVDPDDSKYGFIYSVVNYRTKQVYFGRRVYKYYNTITEERDIPGQWEFYTSGSKPVQEMYVNEPNNLKFTILANVNSNDEASYLEWQLIQHYLLRKLPTGEHVCINQMLPKLFLRGLEKAKDSIDPVLERLMKDLP